jgi:cytidylate kinase
VEQLAAVPSVSESAYVRHLIETILSLGAHGECVIVGRGAAQILPADTTLRVRLVGALEDRITTLARRLGLSREQAARKVEQMDRERRAFIRDHFQKDVTDPRGYDLVLNCFRWSVDESVELLVGALALLKHRPPRTAETPPA